MVKKIQRVAILGLGAVGASYAQQICKYAPDVILYGVVRDLETYWGSPILINDEPLRINYRTVGSLKSVPLDLIIVCVKSYSLMEAIQSMREIVGENTIILSFVSGLTSEKNLIDAFGKKHVLYSCVLNADIDRSGRYITLKDRGTVFFGTLDAHQEPEVQAVKAFFEKCHIKHVVTDRIIYYQWMQMLFNIGFGQTSTVYQLTCGAFRKNIKAMEVMHTAQQELIMLANVCGVSMYESDIRKAQDYLENYDLDSRAPMLQDYWMNRQLETDVLCDYVCTLGEEKGLSMPANLWLKNQLHAMVQKRAEIPVDGKAIKGLSIRRGYLPTPEKIANQLRLDIIRGKYVAGEKISENELARKFDASRSSVRSALQILANEGLLRMLPNGRREVVEFTVKQLKDLYDTRWLIENRALEVLFEKEQTVYPKLAQSLGVIEQKYRHKSTDTDWNDLDVLFHRNLVRSADNLFLANAWESIAQIWYAMLMLQSSTNSGTHYATEFFGKHRYLYKLILTGDRAAFPELKRHIEEEKESAEMILRSISQLG
ncbi:MAG: hypothetical protein ACFWTN_12085 [Clostridium sp.]|jgi:2-dehydropantoate 2-reductase